MKLLTDVSHLAIRPRDAITRLITKVQIATGCFRRNINDRYAIRQTSSHSINGERGDVPGWVLVVLMTTGLVTAIWTIAAPRLSAILRNSLDSMNGIR